MNAKKPVVKSVLQLTAGIFLLVILTCPKAFAEPMEPALSKEAANLLINQINSTKEDEILVNNLLSIARYYLYEEDKACKKYIDRAIAISQKLSYNQGLIKGLCLRAAFLRNISKDTGMANRVVDNAIVLSRKFQLPELEAYACYTKALWFQWLGYDGSEVTEEYCIKARNLYRKTGNKVNEAYLLKCLADFHIGQKKFSPALGELLEALKIYKQAGHRSLHYTYDLIENVYDRLGSYEEALKYGLLAIKSAEQTRDTTDLTLFYFRVAQIFVTLKHPKEALPYFTYVLSKKDKFGGAFYFQRAAASGIASILITTGKPSGALEIYEKAMTSLPVKRGSQEYFIDQYYLGNLYYSLKKYDKAEQFFLRSEEYNKRDAFAVQFNLTAVIRLGTFYISQGRFENARAYIDKALAHKALKSSLELSAINLQQYKVDSASGNYLSAIKHFQIYKAINDSLFNVKKSIQIASLNIQYETEKKEQKIGTLTAENMAQKVLAERRLFERNVFTAGGVMLLLLLLLSINRYRLKQQANKQLQEQKTLINKKNDILNHVLEEKDGLLREKEGLLQSKDKLINEKEWLIKEVHHRVKNNLQMISTLLYSQASYLKNTVARTAINESQQRIHAISLIHQKLYQSESLQLVNMKSYVHELVDYLKESFDSAGEIEFILDVDSFELGILKAIPLGLILNEAITNSLKYAFNKEDKKVISIRLQRSENCSILLQIKDNGKGMPANFNLNQSDSLGISLMNGLSNQINAEFSMKSGNGTVILLEFEDKGESLSEQTIHQL